MSYPARWKNHVQTKAYVSLARNESFALSCHQNSSPQSSRKFPEIHSAADSKNFRFSVSERPKTFTHSTRSHFLITYSRFHLTMQNWLAGRIARQREAPRACPKEDTMTMVRSRGGSQSLGRSALEDAPSMSLTSHLAHHPLGAASLAHPTRRAAAAERGGPSSWWARASDAGVCIRRRSSDFGCIWCWRLGVSGSERSHARVHEPEGLPNQLADSRHPGSHSSWG